MLSLTFHKLALCLAKEVVRWTSRKAGNHSP